MKKSMRWISLLLLLWVGIAGFGCAGDDSSAQVTPVDFTDTEKLLQYTKVSDYPKAMLEYAMAEYSGAITPPEPLYGLTLYRIQYATTALDGSTMRASALAAVPYPAAGSWPLLSVQHGTIIQKSDTPTVALLAEGVPEAAQGYVALIPDYFGFGESSALLHPYIIAEPSARAVADLLIAGKEFAQKTGVALNGKLFLKGYSEGGYVTMAAQKLLEANYSDRFPVTASAPGAGPYDIVATALEYLASSTTLEHPSFLVYLLFSYRSYFFPDIPLEQIFDSGISSQIPSLFDGSRSTSEVDSALPKTIGNLLNSAFVVDFQAQNADTVGNVFRQKMAENSVHEWSPKAPIRMYHCSDDTIVPVINTTNAKSGLTPKAPATVEERTTGTGGHTGCSHYFEALDWFATF